MIIKLDDIILFKTYTLLFRFSRCEADGGKKSENLSFHFIVRLHVFRIFRFIQHARKDLEQNHKSFFIFSLMLLVCWNEEIISFLRPPADDVNSAFFVEMFSFNSFTPSHQQHSHYEENASKHFKISFASGTIMSFSCVINSEGNLIYLENLLSE